MSSPTGTWRLTALTASPHKILALDTATENCSAALLVDGKLTSREVEFDRGHGLRSIPTRFGVTRAVMLSRVMHVLTILAMALLWTVAALPALYLAGVGIVAVLLAYEQSLVAPDDLSQVKRAFDLNGYVGIVYFGATALALYLG